eukprot:CAMPEP_0196680180 /NCGR_PEP_ID=MMETSP1090-20130531/7617_1 /TAXON_ID=37098 /ORGANISM="Isochrysis sp, Strain CCMP1244" /LENGTH=35 /DNA_ID= /DNA_START= /DNA_END= /DNA_ORIENTATION=
MSAAVKGVDRSAACACRGICMQREDEGGGEGGGEG